MSDARILWLDPAVAYADYPAVVVRDGIVWGVVRRDALCALDLRTGTECWRLPTNAASHAPAVTDDRLYFTTSDDQLIAASRRNPAVCWRAALPGAVFHVPVVTADLVVVRANRGTVAAWDKQTGAPRWQVAFDAFVDRAPPLVFDSRVVFTHDRGLTVLDLQTGTLLQQVGAQRSGVLLDDGNALYAFAPGGWEVQLHDRETFEPTRLVRLDPAQAMDVFSDTTTVVDGVLSARSSADRSIKRVDLKAAAPVVETLLRKSGADPTVVDDVVYATPAGQLVAIDAVTRKTRWAIPTPIDAAAAPLIVDDVALIVSHDGVAAVAINGDA